jgi:Peptidase M50B-like
VNSQAQTESRHWWTLFCIGLVIGVLWYVPMAQWLVYPFRLFGTFVHELGHGLAALATGGEFLRFTVSPDLSGLAWSAGGWRWLVTSAGYVGSAVFGGVLIAAQLRGLSAASLLMGLGVALAILCVFFVRNAFGIVTGLGFSIALILASFKFTEAAQDLLLKTLALQLILDGYHSLITVFRISGEQGIASDAHTMEAATGLPAKAWVIFWALLSTAILFLALRVRPRKAAATSDG